jgi:hypothetical protein
VTDRRFAAPVVAALTAALLSGCLYSRQRADDLLDILDLGVGITKDSQDSWIPPTLGALVEFGPLGVGAITHNGVVAEVDGRGLYAGPDSRTRVAGLWVQGWGRWQDYESGASGFYKDESRSAQWHERMRDLSYVKKIFWPGTAVPAKDLIHDDATWTGEVLPMRRGWQYWETIAVEAGISEPFLTHLGFYVRVGVDPSEVLDFLLGIFTLDLRHDDVTSSDLRTALTPGPLPNSGE